MGEGKVLYMNNALEIGGTQQDRALQRVNFLREGAYRPQSVVVRKNRTDEETEKQFNRIMRNGAPRGERMNRLQAAYQRTIWGLEAVGKRPKYKVRMGTRLVSVEEK